MFVLTPDKRPFNNFTQNLAMQPNWIIVGIVIVLGILLVVYLVRRNLKDEKDVTEYFNQQASHFPEDEEEEND